MIAVAALVTAVALIALAMFGDGETYKVKAVFQNAGQLVPGAQVRVGGTPIGTVTVIELDDSSQAVVSMEINEELAPLHTGTQATIRSTSLSAIANRYVSIQPGPNNAEEIDDGGRIEADDTTAPVDLDVLFNTLDADTREGLRNFVRGQADWYAGRSQEAAESTKYVAPFFVSTTDLTRELALDDALLSRFVKDTAATMGAIAERRDDLAGPRYQHEHHGGCDRRRERRPRSRPRSAAGHASQGQHHLRQPALHARRPRRAGQRVQARHA